MTDPTPTAPDWRALCQELRDALEKVFQAMAGMTGEAGINHINAAAIVLFRADVALATPPAPPPEPRGCPTAPIVPRELIRALELAEAALADIGDADREPGDDIAWAERRAAQDLPRIRHALRTWRDHATPPAATREAGPLPQSGPTDEQVLELMPQQFRDDLATVSQLASHGALVGPGIFRVSLNTGALAFARAVLSRWGGAAVPSKVAPTEEDLYDLAEVFNGDPVPAIRRALELWGGAAVPVPVSERPGTGDLDAANRCWWFAESHEGRDAAPSWGYTWRSDDDTHWLPHWALPVPAAAELEGRADG